MRLGQLARKLSVHTSDIVAYLAKENIQIEDGTNTRITPEQESLVIGHFAPHMAMQSKAEPEKSSTEEAGSEAPMHPIDEPVQREEEVLTTENEPPLVAQLEEDSPISQGSENPAKEVDVIKAPKVELKGLKVIGKIDLPTPKKKDTPVDLPFEDAAPEKNTEPVVEKRKRNPPPVKHTTRPRKNPIALKREKEAQEAEEKRRAEALRKKEARTQYYYKRVKPAAPTKAARIINEPTVQESDYMEEKPKTWFGKLMRWLTT